MEYDELLQRAIDISRIIDKFGANSWQWNLIVLGIGKPEHK